MSKLRPECKSTLRAATPNDTVYFLVRDAVARRNGLIHGRLDGHRGLHCAMGAFWEDNPDLVVNAEVVDEIAAVNDSLGSKATPHERWKKVNEWLRFKIKTLMAVKRG